MITNGLQNSFDQTTPDIRGDETAAFSWSTRILRKEANKGWAKIPGRSRCYGKN
jgi:hypothetical protein